MKYDLTSFNILFNNILRNESPSSSQLEELRRELNKFYKGNSQCMKILFTRNTDRAFFGMCVYPNVSINRVSKVFSVDKKTESRGEGYMLELDSKLLDPLLGFTGPELTAILLHEVGHIAIDEAKNDEIISDFVSDYIARKDTTMANNEFKGCIELLKYAYIHTIQKVHSIFNKDDEEFEADRFAVEMGYGPELESAFVKILKAKGTVRPTKKFSTLIWTMTTYKQLFMRKKFLYKAMDEVNEYTGSVLDKEANNKLKKALVQDYKKALTESCMMQDRYEYITEMFGKVKSAGLKAIEDDAYVYAVRIKNVDNEIEAVDILRDLNNKINIVTDYLALEKNLSDNDIRRWNLLLEKLRSLREALIKSDSYKPKYYSLFVQMPVVQRRY